MKKFILPLLSIFFFTACNDSHIEKQNALKKQAIIDATNMTAQIHESYLNCYALNYQNKIQCVSKLNKQYLAPDKLDSAHYKSAFQYEAEKQGFINFLQKSNIACNVLEESPKFIQEAKSYIVQCDNNLHFLRFDYLKEKWVVVK